MKLFKLIIVEDSKILSVHTSGSESTHKLDSGSNNIDPGQPSTRGVRGPFATYKSQWLMLLRLLNSF